MDISVKKYWQWHFFICKMMFASEIGLQNFQFESGVAKYFATVHPWFKFTMQNKKLPMLKWMLCWNYWCKTYFLIEIYIDNCVSKPIFIFILILDMQSTFISIGSFFFNKTCLNYKALIHQIIHINKNRALYSRK